MKTVRCLLLTVLSLFLLWKSFEVFNTKAIPVDDFVSYWAAARLQIQGQNPYAKALILDLERASGSREQEPLVMLNPPWTLAFLLPFGMVDYPVGRIAWLMTGFFAVVLATWWAWQVYGGSAGAVWVAGLTAISFLPLWVVLALGQIDPLILAGLAGFLYFESRSRQSLAGACLVLMTVKPHLFYLFWIALILWVFEARRWSVLLGGVLAGVIAVVIAAAANPSVIFQYFEVISNQPPPLNWLTPTIGTFLRLQLGMDRHWLQFMPMALGVAWLLFWWHRWRPAWIWADQLPLLVLVSLATTSYAWFYDQAILLPSLIQIAATGWGIWSVRRRVWVFALFIGLNAVLAFLVARRLPPIAFLWSFSAWLIFYLIFRQRVHSQRADFVEEDSQAVPKAVS